MIPDRVNESISGTGMAVTVSRDAQFRPSCVRAFGVKVHPNQTTVTYYIAELRSEQLIANFENNGRVALTMAHPEGDSYQLKGKFVSWRQNDEQDDQLIDEYQTRFYEALKQRGMPEELFANWNVWTYRPGVAITFDVETVFGQAPHPDTGKLISEE